MISDLDQLAAWTTHNSARRLDELNRDFAPMPWADGQGGTQPVNGTVDVHGANPIADEWAALDVQGFYQFPDKTLRLKPIVVYPGIILAPWVERATAPPSNAVLWLVVEQQLAAGTYILTDEQGGGIGTVTGWSGQITSTSARLEWGNDDDRPNQGFPGDKFSTMPPNNTIRQNGRFGSTDAHGTFSFTSDGFDDACGQFVSHLL